MKAKEILLKVRALFDMPIVAPPAPPAVLPTLQAAVSTPFKLNDGTEISISIADPAVTAAPSVGDAVTINGAPATAGDYTLEDGTVITVDESGKITAIVAAEPLTQPEFTAPPVKTLEERIADLESKIAAPQVMEVAQGIQTQMSEQAKAFELAQAKITKQDEIIKGLFEMVEKLIEEPTADPKTLTGNKKDVFERMTAKEQLQNKRADALKKIRSKSVA